MEVLDKFYLAILNELQTDGRLSNAELATRVGLSAAPCWRRVRALEETGFIKAYRAEIDRHKIDVLINLPNVKDLHTSFSLGEARPAARCRRVI